MVNSVECREEVEQNNHGGVIEIDSI